LAGDPHDDATPIDIRRRKFQTEFFSLRIHSAVEIKVIYRDSSGLRTSVKSPAEFPLPIFRLTNLRQRKMRRVMSGFGNNPIAAKAPRSVVIAIFAEHSTRLQSSTILLRLNDRAIAAFPSGDRNEAPRVLEIFPGNGGGCRAVA
jgi:hypothetical protein